MIITKTIKKNDLEKIIYQTFFYFNFINSSFLLDSLKLLGFYYATNSGISINIQDLKISNQKKKLINEIKKNIQNVNYKWKKGYISNVERFKLILNNWNIINDNLKNKIIHYFNFFDSTNNLYMMAFSGARGNISQIKQLIGLRGLMSDPEGNIVDLPIEKNFKEGLSSIDYIISSYGARKGIVDTALKTSNSGYLTRRLVYIAQDLVIKEFDCFSKKEILILLSNNFTQNKQLLNRTINNIYKFKNHKLLKIKLNNFLTIKNFKKLIFNKINIIGIRTVLTCQSNESICQKCYGLNVSNKNIISLGENIGIIAAQSLGEPGTQLTMRTFHIGGIYTGNDIKQIKANFSGYLKIPKNIKFVFYRNDLGLNILKIKKKLVLNLFNWKKLNQKIILTNNSYLYFNKSIFIKKNSLIAEIFLKTKSLVKKTLNPILTNINGQIIFNNIKFKKFLFNNKINKIINQNSLIFLNSGNIFLLPKEIKYNFKYDLNKKIPFSTIKIILPYNGLIKILKNNIYLYTKSNIYLINLSFLKKKINNYIIKYSILVKNNQYVDKNTIFVSIEFFSLKSENIYNIKKKKLKNNFLYFLICKSNLKKLIYNQIINYNLKNIFIKNIYNNNILYNNIGFFINKKNLDFYFQHSQLLFINKKTLFYNKNKDFIFKNKIFANKINYIEQTEDIVQGLPKIEELLNSFNFILKKSNISKYSGLILSSLLLNKCLINKNNIKNFIFYKKKNNNNIYLLYNHFKKNNLILFNNKNFKICFLKLNKKNINNNLYFFTNQYENIYLFKNNFIFSIWKKIKIKKNINIYFNNNIKIVINKKNFIFINKKGDYLINLKNNEYIILNKINYLYNFNLNKNINKILINNGYFIDILESLNEGLININHVLDILYKYYNIYDTLYISLNRSILKFQLILINSLQSIFKSQNINILIKHIEIIVKQITDKIKILSYIKKIPFLNDELIKISLFNQIYILLIKYKKLINLNIKPITLSINKIISNKDNFLVKTEYQESKKNLIKASILNSLDWFETIKESIIMGKIIPTGSSYLNYKNYLDNIYLFKN
jgi:hypothetical protein